MKICVKQSVGPYVIEQQHTKMTSTCISLSEKYTRYAEKVSPKRILLIFMAHAMHAQRKVVTANLSMSITL